MACDHLRAIEGAPADTVARAARAIDELLIPLVNADAGIVLVFGYLCADSPGGAWIDDSSTADGGPPRIDYWLPEVSEDVANRWVELALVQVCQRFRVWPALSGARAPGPSQPQGPGPAR